MNSQPERRLKLISCNNSIAASSLGQPSTLDLASNRASMPLAGPKSSQVRIRERELFADIFSNPGAGSTGYRFIIQQENSSDLLHWGREKSRQAALRAASALMKFLAKERSMAATG